jgi:hypothetical protein
MEYSHNYSNIKERIDDLVTELVSLRALENELVQKELPNGSRAQQKLAFDETKLTISWLGGSVKLTKVPYRFIKTLWSSDRHRTGIDVIEQNVWQIEQKNRVFIPRSTICSCVSRTNATLQKAKCPYKIKPSLSRSTREIKGYKLICVSFAKNASSNENN